MNESPKHQNERQKLITMLQELGIFNSLIAIEVQRKLVAVGENPGALRESVYNQWYLEMEPFAEEGNVPKDFAVMMGLLSQFDLYGLELLVQDAQVIGVKLAYARLLESAFQYATKIGDAYQSAKRIDRLNWKNVYLILKSQEWDPF